MNDGLWEDPDPEDRKFIWFNALKEINKTGEQHVDILKVQKWRFCLYEAEVSRGLVATAFQSQYYKGGRSAPHEYLGGNQDTGHMKLNLTEAQPLALRNEITVISTRWTAVRWKLISMFVDIGARSYYICFHATHPVSLSLLFLI